MSFQDSQLAWIQEQLNIIQMAKETTAEMPQQQRESSVSDFHPDFIEHAHVEHPLPRVDTSGSKKRRMSLDALHFERLGAWFDRELDQETSSKKRKPNEEARQEECTAAVAATSFSGPVDAPNDLRQMIEEGSVFEHIAQLPIEGSLQQSPHRTRCCSSLKASSSSQQRIPSMTDLCFGDSGDLANMILDGNFFDEDPLPEQSAKRPSSIINIPAVESVAASTTHPSDLATSHAEGNVYGHYTMDDAFLGDVQITHHAPPSASAQGSNELLFSTAPGSYSTTSLGGISDQSSTFVQAMEMSERSQKLIRDWDKMMGLKACHSKTMLQTGKSRDQLMENNISSVPMMQLVSDDKKKAPLRQNYGLPAHQNSQTAAMA